MKKLTTIIVGLLAMCISSVAWTYDTAVAQSYAKLFEPVAGATAGKALHLMSPAAFVKGIQKGTKFVAVDVRTPFEVGVFSVSMADGLAIPANQIFHPENLDRLPTDRPVVIICQSGFRALAVGTGLRHIGFDNVFILKGGFKGLSTFMGPKESYPKP